MSARQAVLILAGGPDPEHDVSLDSARGIERALRARGAFEPVVHPFETIDADALASLPGDVIWPALHGRFGEGGAMQRILESDGRPFVGSGSRAAEIAIDKAESKRAAHACARELGLDRVRTSETVAFDPSDGSAPMGFPFVVKPTHEGSTIGLHICRDEREWRRAHAGTARAGWEAMAEPFIEGRELTIGMVDAGAGLGCRPIIEITPAGGTYDYEAKYERDDTAYTSDPQIPAGTAHEMRALCAALTSRIGVLDLCRVDFIMDGAGVSWFLELNTMPGFTPHSLVPMSCAEMGIGGLCERLVECALARAGKGTTARSV